MCYMNHSIVIYLIGYGNLIFKYHYLIPRQALRHYITYLLFDYIKT